MNAADDAPRVVVFSSLFPSSVAPNAGLFIRERMFRVGRTLPIEVVSPVPWFPLQSLLRLWRPGFRRMPPSVEHQQGITIHHPRFLSVPGFFKHLDGLSMALGSLGTLWRIKRRRGFDVLDAHFAYPDGYAATRLGRWLGVPVTITLRGTEARLVKSERFRRLVVNALERADRVFCVAAALRETALSAGVDRQDIQVVGNGVDIVRFSPIDTVLAREKLGLNPTDPVLVSVGGLVERKGFHRVLEVLPELLHSVPNLRFLIVGGGGAEGDWEGRLKSQVEALGLTQNVRFLGPVSPDELHVPLSAADVFVLATRNEGWANVFLEAMACGLPVITTNVGGNAEVVCRPEIGRIVEFGRPDALLEALKMAFASPWNAQEIRAYALENQWDKRVEVLVEEFRALGRHRV